jgi:nicotinate-nucleotide adenylyltransferase
LPTRAADAAHAAGTTRAADTIAAGITPLPVPLARALRRASDRRRPLTIVVCGGSFDPPHAWHALGARRAAAVLTRADPDAADAWVLYVPAARSPHKGEPGASDAQRLRMLRLALRDAGPVEGVRWAIWTDEIDRARAAKHAARASGGVPQPPPSYTVDTLKRLREAVRAAQREDPREAHRAASHATRASSRSRACVRLLIGADQAAAFHRWKSARRVMALAEPLVVLRPPLRTRAGLRRELTDTGAWTRAEIDAWLARLSALPPVAASSTDVRDAIARGREGGGSVLSPAVRAFIAARGLYGARKGPSRRPNNPRGGSTRGA